MRLDEVAKELYAAPPGEFVAARDEHVRRAKEAGDRELATRLGKLRRPTQSAWLVNLLWRQRRELMQELFTLGEEFRGEELTRERLHELSTRRRELLHRLLSEAQRLSDDAGMQLSAERAREIESTLAAAVADPDAAEQVRGGRLVTALSYSGLGPELQFIPPTAATGTGPATGVGAGPGPAAGARAGGSAAPTRSPTESGAMPRPQAATTGPGENAAATAEARAAAGRLVYQRTETWEDAIRQRDGLVRRRDELRLELRRAQQRLDRAEEELTEAEQLVQACAESLEQARRAAGQA